MTEQPERGRQAVAEYLRTVWRAFPDLTFSWPEGPYASFQGIKLALHWRVTGAMLGPIDPPGFAPTGRRIDLEGVDLLEIRDGLCCSYQGFFDRQAVAQQVGAAPADRKPGGAGRGRRPAPACRDRETEAAMKLYVCWGTFTTGSAAGRPSLRKRAQGAEGGGPRP